MANRQRSLRRLFRTSGLGALFLTLATAGAYADEMTVQGKEFEFLPADIEIAAGEELIITFENTGKLSHNVTFPKLDKQTETIQAGNTTKITVSPEEAGTYEYICDVPGHADAGMRGELVVTE